MRPDTPRKQFVDDARKKSAKKPVVYTQDSRESNGLDAMWSGTCTVGASVVFPLNTQAVDFVVPDGKTAIVKSVYWTDSPAIFVSTDDQAALVLYHNKAASLNFRRSINGGAPSFSSTQFPCGFLQGVFLPTFLRADSGDVITVEIQTFGGLVVTSIRIKLFVSLINNDGQPVETGFTNL